ncbi:MAG TPA: DinB family protein [Candidatus Dormibacteraeota bacterium]|nr:DinB family protein [Candidatus Dormibacteraeota bacterium]
MASDILLQAARYNRWANLRLLDVCSALSAEQLGLASPGTYGSIAATWQHLLGAEQRYLRRLVGYEPRLTEDDAFPGIAELKEHAQRSGDALVDAVGRFDPDGTSNSRDDSAPKHWLVMNQAIHHGNDHRTHICTILGQNGISYGDLDVWAFGEAHDGYVKC